MLTAIEMNEMIRLMQQKIQRLEDQAWPMDRMPPGYERPPLPEPESITEPPPPPPETPSAAYKRVIIDPADPTARHERMAEAMHDDNREYLLSEGMPATSVLIWPDTDPKTRARWRNLARVADAARGE